MINIELLHEKAEIVGKLRSLIDKAEEARRDLTEDEDREYSNLDKRLTQVVKLLERSEKLDKFEEERKKIVNPLNPMLIGSNGSEKRLDDGGFRNLGEYIHSVVQFRKEGISDDRLEALRPEARAQSMGTGAEGGFLLPEQFIPNLLMVKPQEAIVLPRATVIPPGDPPDAKLIMPALDQTSGSNVYGGIQMVHSGENVTLSETDASFRQVTLEPRKLAGYLVVSNELLNNWDSASSVLSTLMLQAVSGQFDTDACLGSGVNCAQGFINSAAAVLHNRAGAGAIAWADIYNMYARLKMGGGSPVWLASQTVIPQLAAMVSSGGAPVWLGSRGDGLQGAQGGLPPTLMGFPIIFSDRLPALGTKGDLNLVDLKYYLVKLGSGPQVDVSKELLFLTDRSVLRLTWRIDGKPWLSEPLGLEGSTSNTVSPFVVLDTP